MTRQCLSLARCLPKGITHEFNTPCAKDNFSKSRIQELFQNKLPTMISSMGASWAEIHSGQVSGLAPTMKGGPIDHCIVNGSWSAERQAAHGGPIPLLSGAHASRCVPEIWPYTKSRWTQVGHSNWVQTSLSKAKQDETAMQNPDWTRMNWTNAQSEQSSFDNEDNLNDGFVPTLAAWDPYGGFSSQSYSPHHGQQWTNQAWNKSWPIKRRKRKKNPKRTRGGLKKHRCDPKK